MARLWDVEETTLEPPLQQEQIRHDLTDEELSDQGLPNENQSADGWANGQPSSEGFPSQSLTDALVDAVSESHLKYKGSVLPFFLTARGDVVIFFTRRQNADLERELERKGALEQEALRILQTRRLYGLEAHVLCIDEP